MTLALTTDKVPTHAQTQTKMAAMFSVPNLLTSEGSRLDLEVSDPPRAWGRH